MQIKRSNSQSHYNDRSVKQADRQAQLTDERLSCGMQPPRVPVPTYLRYHGHMLLLALALSIVDVVLALRKSLLLLQMCHKRSDVVEQFLVVHQ
jgi:ABC-type taurine transport system ATPase subunit